MKKKLLSMLLVMSMVASMTACGKAPESDASSQAVSSQAVSSAEASGAADVASTAEATVQASGETASQAAGEKSADVVITDEKIKTILLAMSEQMKDDPSMQIDMYTVNPTNKDVFKAMVMQVAENEKLTYVKMGTPFMQMELYKQEDGHLYVDLSVDQMEEGTDTSEAYFDGTRYHQLAKAEPKEEAEDSTSGVEDFMENPTEDIDENTEFKVYDQTKIGENTVVAVAIKNEDEEQHMLVYLKGEQVEKLIASSAQGETDQSETAEAASSTDAYAVVNLKSAAPASVPEYFNTVEFTDADEVNSAAALGLMGILFSAMGAGDAGEDAISYTGEWAANAGGMTVSEAEEIKTLLDLKTAYFE